MYGSENLWKRLLIAALVLVSACASSAAFAQSALRASAPTRARLGIEAGLGAAVGDTRGGAYSLAGQLGLQANDLFAVYWKPGLYVDGWPRDPEDKLDVFVFGSHLAMVDFTLGRWFQLGGGAGIDLGRFGVCDTSGSNTECEMRSRQVQPAIEGRVALIIPLPGIRARWGIPIVFNAHTTFFAGRQIHSLTLGSGILRF
jgi:hypothetical protein